MNAPIVFREWHCMMKECWLSISQLTWFWHWWLLVALPRKVKCFAVFWSPSKMSEILQASPFQCPFMLRRRGKWCMLSFFHRSWFVKLVNLWWLALRSRHLGIGMTHLYNLCGWRWLANFPEWKSGSPYGTWILGCNVPSSNFSSFEDWSPINRLFLLDILVKTKSFFIHSWLVVGCR